MAVLTDNKPAGLESAGHRNRGGFLRGVCVSIAQPAGEASWCTFSTTTVDEQIVRAALPTLDTDDRSVGDEA